MHSEMSEETAGTWGTAEAARFLGCTESTLRAWVSQGRVPYVKLGRLTRFLKSDLVRHVNKHRVDTVEAASGQGLPHRCTGKSDG